MTEQIFPREFHKEQAPTGGNVIEYSDPDEMRLLSEFRKGTDSGSLRMMRLIDLPDLTRKADSPIKFIVDRILQMPEFQNFDIVIMPETIKVQNSFDVFNVPVGHPSRQPTDTYFLSTDRILRTQTTVMWFYYLNDPEIRTALEQRGYLSALSYGKVYRKDEIDRNHFPVFHQMDGLHIVKKQDKQTTPETLQDVLRSIIHSVFGPGIEFRFLEDTFPFTDPSTQIEIKYGDQWLEVVGGGMVHQNVMRNLGLDPEIYNGWAFGFGLERLAMIKNNIPDIRLFWSNNPRITKQFKNIDSQFVEVSKYPAIVRDISFIVPKSFAPNVYFDLVRDVAGDLAEQVALLDEYENEEKFGKDKKSYAYRITYRSNDRTLTSGEIDVLHKTLEQKTAEEFGATVR